MNDLYVTCRRCGGWGSIETSQSEDGRFSYQDQCPECSSQGVVPADVDYEAAMRVMRSWLVEDNDAPLLSAVRWAVDAALGVGEPVEGNRE